MAQQKQGLLALPEVEDIPDELLKMMTLKTDLPPLPGVEYLERDEVSTEIGLISPVHPIVDWSNVMEDDELTGGLDSTITQSPDGREKGGSDSGSQKTSPRCSGPCPPRRSIIPRPSPHTDYIMSPQYSQHSTIQNAKNLVTLGVKDPAREVSGIWEEIGGTVDSWIQEKNYPFLETLTKYAPLGPKFLEVFVIGVNMGRQHTKTEGLKSMVSELGGLIDSMKVESRALMVEKQAHMDQTVSFCTQVNQASANISNAVKRIEDSHLAYVRQG